MIENYGQFKKSLTTQSKPDDTWPDALKAMWYDAAGNWSASHDIAQELHTDLGSWIHAYLHRKEGDDWNAGYWYNRAHKKFPKISLEEELKEIVEYVLAPAN